jgi:ParB family chromosome partitioning protein
MSEMRKQVLGRGLSSLFSSSEEEPISSGSDSLPIENVLPGINQPRRFFDEDALRELSSSIQEKGVLQPILVRNHPEFLNKYEIIAGERRWRASKMVGLTQIPAIVKDFSDAEVLEVGLLENIQRKDLNPIEEASAFHRLAEEFNYTQDALSRILGKSRSHIANTLRLLTLPLKVQNALVEGRLSASHGRALVGLKNAEALALKIIDKGLSVRETETLIRGKTPPQESLQTPSYSDPELEVLKKHLDELLGVKVDIHMKGLGGKLTIPFKDLVQLDTIIQKLNT